MRHKLIEEKPKTYAIIWFDWQTKEYKPSVNLDEQVVLTEASEKLQKQIDPESGIALICP